MNKQNYFNKKRLSEIILFLIILVFGFFYINLTWNKFENNRSIQILQIGKSISVVLPISDIKSLNANSEDNQKPQYQALRKFLKDIITVNTQAKFAYLYTERDGKIFFRADSEPEDSEDYSPPGQEYVEATDIDKQPFKDGKQLVTPPLTDRWGTWISVLIPIKDPETNKVVAVFGMDFNAKSWDKLLVLEVTKSSILMLLLLFAAFFLINIRQKNISLKHEVGERKKAEEKLKLSEERYRLLSDVTIEGILIHKNGIAIDLNQH